MDYDNPARYDLSDPNSDSFGPTAKMESNPRGDYVEFATYDGLLDAYHALRDTMASIHDLSQ